jgi:hypothetical protein
LCPFTMLMSSPWKKSLNVPPRTKNKAWIFVNSFPFNFLEFLAKIYRANFSHRLRRRKRAVHEKQARPGPRGRVGRPAQSDRPRWVPTAVDPSFCPNCSFSNSFFGQNFKGNLNKENEDPRVFLFGLFIWPNWELGNESIKQYFAPTQQPLCPQGA